MGNISAITPQIPLTVTAIYDWHKKKIDAEPRRGYLGASYIGHECERFLWYTFRKCVRQEFDGRMHRLFETGHLAEPRFFAELRGIGCTVNDFDENGKQYAIHLIGGHFSGHLDGALLGIPEAPKTWHVLETKTHNSKSFEKTKELGVKLSKPLHYDQMQVYMGATGMTRALYLFVNKDTDEIWSERIEFNAAEYKALVAKATRIVKAQHPPVRMATRPDDHRCKYCDARGLCWGSAEMALPVPCISCRSCCHATPEHDTLTDEAWWSCKKHGKNLTPDEQDKACQHHLVLPSLIMFAEVVDASETWIEFKNTKDGAVWRHGSDLSAGEYTSCELMILPGPMVGDKTVSCAKKAFEGAVIEDGGTIPDSMKLENVFPEDMRMVWDGVPVKIDEQLKILGIDHDKPTEETKECDGYIAVTYGRYMVVVYKKAHNYAAIWDKETPSGKRQRKGAVK